MTAALRDTLARLRERATQGEWTVGHVQPGNIPDLTAPTRKYGIDWSEADFQYIAALHNAFPALAAALEMYETALSVAKCPTCDGSGSYQEGNEQMQCEWCFMQADIRAALAQPDEKENR